MPKIALSMIGTENSNNLKSGPKAAAEGSGKCSLKDGATGTIDPAMKALDWAVVKIKTPVRNVKPYGLEVSEKSELEKVKETAKANGENPDEAGIPYTMVSAIAKNFRDQHATTFQSVNWMDIETSNGEFYMKADGDTGNWMSGSPVINENRNIKGILVKGTSQDCAKYNKNSCFDSLAPVTQEMYEAARSISRK
jgi:hypothetical protein